MLFQLKMNQKMHILNFYSFKDKHDFADTATPLKSDW